MSRYFPENNYKETNYTPIKAFDTDMCVRCTRYYESLYTKGITKYPFPVNCTKHIQNQALYIKPEDFDTLVEYNETVLLLDPISWAYAEFGWEPRFYQSDMLSCSAQHKLYRMGRRVGKCLIKDTKVATPIGPKNIQDIRIGDIVYNEYGKEISVKNTFDQGPQLVVDLINHNRVYATCTLDHPWQVIDRNGERKVKKTRDISKYDRIVRVEPATPLGIIRENYAYVLGVLSGDGSCRESGLIISSSEAEKIKKVANLLNTTFKKTSANNYHWYLPQNNKQKISHYYDWLDNRYAHQKLADLNVIKTWDRYSVLEYIAGLLDTDGSVYFDGKEIQISFGLQSLSIAEAFQYALLALWGIDASIAIDNRPKYKNGPVYTISVKNIYHCKRILKELDPHLCVVSKKYRVEFDSLIPHNFNPTGVGVKLSNLRVEHCYDLHVDSSTNLYCLANGLVTHNTEGLVVEILHHVTTHRDHTILVVAPYERQVTRIFDELNRFLSKSVSLRGSVARYTKTPSRMEFNNGSKILGFSAGAGSASGSDKIRGQDAHLIVIDEIDTLEDEDIDAVTAILASHTTCKLVAATTPRGWRRKFYTFITDKDLGFKEFWFISAESPEWTDKAEEFFKGSTDATTYAHEYLADFAELEEGVFKAKHLNASIQDYSLNDCDADDTADYILGVDWNKSAGTHMTILQWSGNYLKLVKKIIVTESDYTQTDAVDLIINLNRHWRFKYIFVDAGYGTVQTELLRKHALKEPSSKFDTILYAVHMNQHLDVIDPISGEAVKRTAKPFLIEQTRKLLEDGYLILPKEEDTAVSASESNMGLIQQMRNFRIESVSIYGLPRYSQGADHTLTAYYLACGGFFWKEGDLKRPPYVTGVRGVETFQEGTNAYVHPSIVEIRQTERQGYKLTNTTGKHYDRSKLGSTVRSNIQRSVSRSSQGKSDFRRRRF